MQTSSLVKS